MVYKIDFGEGIKNAEKVDEIKIPLKKQANNKYNHTHPLDMT